MFIGAPTKTKHLSILERYNSEAFHHINAGKWSWNAVRNMTQTMFSGTSWSEDSRVLHFYGNDGVCLFKYFVTREDPQATFSLFILFLNFACFLTITACYITIHLLVRRSDRSKRRNKTVLLQTKVIDQSEPVILVT